MAGTAATWSERSLAAAKPKGPFDARKYLLARLVHLRRADTAVRAGLGVCGPDGRLWSRPLTRPRSHSPQTGSAIRRDGATRPQPRDILAIAESLTSEDLPPAGVACWNVRRKAEVVAGVFAGLISLDEVFRRYRLSADEFLLWQWQLSSHGVLGLRSLHPRISR